MNNQLKNDHYVYALIDSSNEIRFIGQGRQARYKRTQGRSEEYMNILNNNGVLEFLSTNLTKEDAISSVEGYISESSINGRICNLINKIRLRGKSCIDVIYEEVLNYVYFDESSPTGLRWISNAKNLGFSRHASAVKKDAQAGWPATQKNYGGVQFNGKTFHLHRIIWAIHNKKDVPWNLVVNHIDSDITNNNPTNLEIANYSTNSKKKAKQYNNTTGVCGVAYCKVNGNYIAHIYIDGKRIDKNFSSKKLGDALALQLAKEWREEMESLHYKEKFVTHQTALYLKE